MAAAKEDSSSQSPKILIATALITSLTTVAVSFIGVVPQMRSQDRSELAELRKALDDLKQKPPANQPQGDKPIITVTGTVKDASGSKTLAGYDVYLLPEGNNLLTAKTDDSGKFTMLSVPAGVYSIIVRDSTNGQSGKGLLDGEEVEVKVRGALIQYRIQGTQK